MDMTVRGKVFVLGNDIDTDQIIPAEVLSYNPSDPAERKEFGRRAMSGVPVEESGLPEGKIPFVQPGSDKSDFAVIVAGSNFGCGSSREHAPLALAEAGCTFVIAESYARIFFRNSVNGGYLLPLETPQRLVDKLTTGSEVEVDVEKGLLRDIASGTEYKINPLGDVAEIVSAGGLFNYARQSGLLK